MFKKWLAKYQSLNKKKRLSIQFGCLTAIGIFFIIIGILALIPYREYKVYQDPESRVTIKYPIYWGFINRPEGGAIVAFLSPKEGDADTFIENVNISTYDMSANPMSLEEFSQFTTKQTLGTLGAYVRPLESKPIMVGKRQGFKLMYVGKTAKDAPGQPMEFLHVWFVDGTKAYILTYVGRKNSFGKFLPEVNDMIKSFDLY